MIALTLAGGVIAAQPNKYSATLVPDGGCTFHIEASWKGGREIVQVGALVYIDRSPVGQPDLLGYAPQANGSTLTRSSATVPFGPIDVDTETTHTFTALVQFYADSRGGQWTAGQAYTNQVTMGCRLASA